MESSALVSPTKILNRDVAPIGHDIEPVEVPCEAVGMGIDEDEEPLEAVILGVRVNSTNREKTRT